MAKRKATAPTVTVVIAPGGDKTVRAGTVGDVYQQLGIPAEFRVWVNGAPASPQTTLAKGDRVVVAAPVKGGC